MLFHRRHVVTAAAGLMGLFAPTAFGRQLSGEPAMDSLEITNTVNRVALLSDLRDWATVKACFTEQVEVDYTSLMGGQPEAIAAEALVQRWKSFFDATFKTTQHLLGSHVVTFNGNTATCMSHFQARHIPLDSAKEPWTLGGYYTHELVKQSERWLIQKMKMVWTWESGDRPFS